MSERQRVPWWRLLQGIVGIAILVVAIMKFRDTWAQAEATRIAWVFDMKWIAASLVVTWTMYALLITGWRLVLTGWGQRISWVGSARIWTISSLAGLLPGGIWSIAGMAVMAKRAGISAAAATGSAIVMQLLSMCTGAVVGLLLLGPTLISGIQWGMVAVVLLATVALLAAFSLTSVRFMGFLTKVLKRPEQIPALAPSALVAGLVINAVAWAGYGGALVLLARGTIPTLPLTWRMATGAFSLAYLVGYIVPVPGGVGVREYFLILLLGPQIGDASVGALALASRLATLITQFGSTVPFLFIRSSPSDNS